MNLPQEQKSTSRNIENIIMKLAKVERKWNLGKKETNSEDIT